jgi:hypothetical protein
MTSILKPITASVITSSLISYFRDYNLNFTELFTAANINATLSDFTDLATTTNYNNPLFIFLSSFVFCYLLMYHLSTLSRTPARFVAQSLGEITNNIEPETSTSDLITNELLHDTIPQRTITTSLQTQVASEITELTTLSAEKLTALYSTPMYVGTYAVASTTAIGTIFGTIASNFTYTNKNILRLFTDYRFASFDLRYTINVTGNPMASGLVICFNRTRKPTLPYSFLSQDTSYVQGISNPIEAAFSLPHVIIDLSIDGVYTIDVPFQHYDSYLAFNNYLTVPSFSNVNFLVVSPLLPAQGSTSNINFEVYATVMNLATCETAPYVAQSFLSIGGTTNITTKLDRITNSSLPVNVTGDALSATLPKSLGLDNPSDTRNPPPLLSRLYQKLTATMNVLDVFRTVQNPKPLTTVSHSRMKDLRLDVDETNLDYFRDRWSYIQSASFDTTTANNSVLYKLSMQPYYPTTSGPSSFQSFANFYTYWRGSLRYRILIASNIYKRAKILVAIHYNVAPINVANIATGALDPRSVPHLIVDISSTDRFVDIEIPYKSIHEMLRCRAPNTIAPQAVNFDEYSLGTLAVYLVSPLQISNGVAATVNLTLLNSWGSDFQLMQDYDRKSIYGQSMLSPPSMISTPENRLSSMSICRSIKEIVMRPTLIGEYVFPSPANSLPIPMYKIPIHPILMNNSTAWSWIMSAYAGMIGSLRVIVRYNFGNYPIRINYYPYLFDNNSSASSVALNDTYTSPNTAIAGAAYPYVDVTLPTIYTNNNTTNYSQAPNNYQVSSVGTNVESLCSYNNPEVIMELPDCAPLYRTQATQLVPTNYNFSNVAGKYTPSFDRNISVLTLGFNDANASYDTSTSVSVYVMAADDTRFFWYNGGPTAEATSTLTVNTATISSAATYQ